MSTDWITEHVLTEESLNDLCEKLRAAEFVCFDLETQSTPESNLEDWHATSRIVSASFTVPEHPDTGFVVPLSHPEGPWGNRWRDIALRLANACRESRLLGHNLKYDTRWLASATGVSELVDRQWWCTSIAAKILNENRSARLKVRAGGLMGGDWSTNVDLSDSEAVPWFDLAVYNAADTVATLRLYLRQRDALESLHDLASLFVEISMPLSRTLTRAELRGLPLDARRAAKATYDAEKLEYESEGNLMEVAVHRYQIDFPGKISWQPTSLWFLNFMAHAVENCDIEVLEKSRKTGKPSWNASVLKRLDAEGSAIARSLLQYRHATKQVQFLKSWAEKADNKNRLHPTYNVGGARTGRLSSSNPNAQQIARELKPCFGFGES